MSQTVIDFEQHTSDQTVDPIYPELTHRDRLDSRAHELGEIIVKGGDFKQWTELAEYYSIEQLYPQGTDFDRIPDWIKDLFDRSRP